MQNNKSRKLAYIDQGLGIPILFIHGYPLSKNLWVEQIGALSTNFRCIAPDLRGYGQSVYRSTPGGGQQLSMDTLAEDCANLLTDLGIEEPVVISGHSMGGYVSFAFYRRFPHRVRALVLSATRAGADSPEARTARDNAIATATQSGSQPIIESMLPKLISPESFIHNRDLVQRVKEIMSEASVEGMIASLQAMKERPDSTPLLPKITCPTLIIHGIEDQIIPLAETRLMTNSIPGAKLVVIEAAGHLPNVEQPDKYNQVLQGFLNSL